MTIKVLGICGSLRKASLNMAALRACSELLPEGMSLEIASIADLPIYNQDVFDQGMPEPVKRFRDQVTAADGLLIASPEYNFSIPAPLKNAIDWGSRPPNQVFHEKPAAIFSASTGRNSTTERKIPQQVLTGAFASGFRLGLMAKDVGIAARLARDLGVPAPFLSETLKLWRAAERRLPAGADLTEIYRYLERLRTPSRGAASPRSRSPRAPRRSTSPAGPPRPGARAPSHGRGRAANNLRRARRRRA